MFDLCGAEVSTLFCVSLNELQANLFTQVFLQNELCHLLVNRSTLYWQIWKLLGYCCLHAKWNFTRLNLVWETELVFSRTNSHGFDVLVVLNKPHVRYVSQISLIADGLYIFGRQKLDVLPENSHRLLHPLLDSLDAHVDKLFQSINEVFQSYLSDVVRVDVCEQFYEEWTEYREI